MNDTDFFETTYRIINKYNTKTKSPKQYGTEHLLYSSEVHMIEVIGHHNALTTTQIANLQGITKGAVSQTTSKLNKKNLIKKELSPDGNNEVLISLTETGQIIYKNHANYHKQMIIKLVSLASELSFDSKEIILKILDTIEKSLETY